MEWHDWNIPAYPCSHFMPFNHQKFILHLLQRPICLIPGLSCMGLLEMVYCVVLSWPC